MILQYFLSFFNEFYRDTQNQWWRMVWRGGRKADGAGLGERGRAGGRRSFVCCVLSAISLMKWSAEEGKPHGCSFREHRTGCPLLPARPFEHRISISLVKSDGKLKTKLRLPPAPLLSPSPAPSAFLPPRHTIRHHWFSPNPPKSRPIQTILDWKDEVFYNNMKYARALIGDGGRSW